MSRAAGVALLMGLALGLIGGGLIARSRGPRETPPIVQASPPPAPPAPPPPPTTEPAPSPEVEQLKTRIRELESKLAARAAVETPPTAADEIVPDKTDWSQKLDALLKTGAGAYKGAKFMAMAAELKKIGEEAIQTLSDKLLHAESGGERFLAAALLEDLDDPTAIPALAQSLQKDEDLLVRRMSSHAIAVIENEQGLAALRTAMAADSDWGVRVNSAYGVAKLGQPDGVKTLEDAYKSATTPAEYKLPVLGGLADVAAPSSAPIFRKVLAESMDVTYLYVAIGAVQKMNDVSFVPELNRIAADAKYSTNVREMAKKAAEALSK